MPRGKQAPGRNAAPLGEEALWEMDVILRKGMLPHSQAQLHDPSVAMLRVGDNGRTMRLHLPVPSEAGCPLALSTKWLPLGAQLCKGTAHAPLPAPPSQSTGLGLEQQQQQKKCNKKKKTTKHDFKWDGPSQVGVSLQQAA